MVTSAETRNQIKAPNFGINWISNLKSVEVVNSLTGKTMNGQVSRITKQAFFNKYSSLIKRLPNVGVRQMRGDYGDAKMIARDYQVTIKLNLYECFKDSVCWTLLLYFL